MTTSNHLPPNSRYHRQMLLPWIGQSGQRKLAESRILLVGCGALGTVMADQLCRAGVGYLMLVDRDLVEITNLQRQVLFDEADAADSLPKAVAAQRRLRQINSQTEIDARVEDVHCGNIADLLRASQAQLILDGTDNIETRYLINDLAVREKLPWVYGAAVASEGRAMCIRPGSACLRCVFPTPPPASQLGTCDTIGVLGPAVAMVASMQVSMAIKLLTGNVDAVGQDMLVLDLWSNHIRLLSMAEARRDDCICCGQRRFEFLDQSTGPLTTSLCGRNAVQVRTGRDLAGELDGLTQRLASVGKTERTAYLLRCQLRDPAEISLTVFPDGRILVHGTHDPARARSLVARFVGG